MSEDINRSLRTPKNIYFSVPSGHYTKLLSQISTTSIVDIPSFCPKMIKAMFTDRVLRHGRYGMFRCDYTKRVYAFVESSNKSNTLRGAYSSISYEELETRGSTALNEWKASLPRECYEYSYEKDKKRKTFRGYGPDGKVRHIRKSMEQLKEKVRGPNTTPKEEGCLHNIPLSKWCAMCDPEKLGLSSALPTSPS